MPQAAIYARVSTKAKLGEKGQSTDMQLGELTAYAGRQGWPFQVYDESASAAGGKKRPVFEQLMLDARLKKIDIIVVWKIDRFGRSLIEFVNNMLELERLGIRFIAVTQGIDTDARNPMNKTFMNLLAVMAEFEHDLISERVKAGIARRREKGLKCGGGTQWKVIDMQKVLDMKEQGYSIREIAQFLEQKPSTIFRRLKVYQSKRA